MPVRPLQPHERVAATAPAAEPAIAVYSKLVEHYDVGHPVLLPVQWTDAAGEPVTPRDVTCVVRKPNGTKLTLAATEREPGFVATVVPDAPGQWWYRFTASGSHQGVAEHLFVVRHQRA